MIAGLESVDQGRVILHGRDVTALPARHRNIGFCFQDYAPFYQLSVFENVAYGLRTRKVPKHQIQADVTELLELVHLGDFAHRYPRQLSGGQRQAVAIGRAVAWAKHVIILDEPTNHLGARQSQEVLNVIKAAREQGLCVLFISHTLPHVLEVTDRIIVLRLGEVVKDAPTSDFTVESLLGTITGLTV